MGTRPPRPRRVRVWHGILFGTLVGAAHALVSDASRPADPPQGRQGPVRVAIVVMVSDR